LLALLAQSKHNRPIAIRGADAGWWMAARWPLLADTRHLGRPRSLHWP
jgi:hypothetical protein